MWGTNILKEKKWTIISFLIVLAFILTFNFLITSKLQALPSPLYGGDYYYQLGQTNHVKYGGSPLTSATINGALPGYFVTYSAIAGYTARIFNIDGITAHFLLSYITIILAAIIMYAFTFKLFKNIYISAISTLILITPINFPIIKYTVFAYFVMVPLCLLLIYNFMEKRTFTSALYLGIAYGITGLTHSVAFISITFLLVALFIYQEIIVKKSILHIFSKKEFKNTKKMILSFAIIFVVGVLIAMLWWFKPIFIYHGQTSEFYNDWNNASYSTFSQQMNFVWVFIKSLLNFTNIVEIITTIFFLLGVIGMFFIKKDSEETKFLKFLLISSIIITLHYLLTENLIHTNFIPSYMIYLLATPVKILVATLGVYIGYTNIKAHLSSASSKKIVVTTYFIIIILLLAIGHFLFYKQAINNQWYNVGKSPLADPQVQLRDYLTKNTAVTDTILTTKEVGFGLNALTGRKLVITRRAQNDPFLDMDSRELAAAIILYGNNLELKKELIAKYDIKYIYWDYYWIQSEYNFDNTGRVTGWFDPLIMFYSPEREKLLIDNNVSYFVQNTWVDPTLKGDDFKKFDIIFISPQNYRTQQTPWNENLEPYMKEVWAYDYQGSKIAVLYKIDIR